MPLSVAESAMEARVTWRSSGMKQQLRDRSKGLRMMTHLLLPSTAGNDRLLLFPNVLEQLKSKAAMINSAMAAGSTTLGEEREDEDEVEEPVNITFLLPKPRGNERKEKKKSEKKTGEKKKKRYGCHLKLIPCL